MNAIAQLKPIFDAIDESMEVIEKVPPYARFALLAYLQLVMLRVERKALSERGDNEPTKADVECLTFAVQIKKICNAELKAALNERNNNEKN